MAKAKTKTKATSKGKAKPAATAKKAEPIFGVHSEVGQLRKVMVCAPGRAHARGGRLLRPVR